MYSFIEGDKRSFFSEQTEHFLFKGETVSRINGYNIILSHFASQIILLKERVILLSSAVFK
jgi:hypothetical protein